MIVVSSLDKPEEIARGIELGAVDFLPKSFNAVILEARIHGCLREKRRQEEDRRTLHQIQRLTQAAEELDADEMNPRDLDIADLAEQDGALAVLSGVLLNKSIMVYNRRQHQENQIQVLRGVLLLALMGACFGIKPALANRLSEGELVPWVSSFFTLCLTAILLTTFALAQRRPFARYDWRSGRVVLLLGVFGPFLPSALLMWVSGSVPSVTISILLPLEAFMVTVICTSIGLEKMTRKRMLGLFLGLVGVLIVLAPSLTLGGELSYLFLALCIPASYAIRTVVMRAGTLKRQDPVTLAATFYGVAIIFSTVTLFVSGAFRTLRFPDLETSAILTTISFAEATGILSLIYLVRTAGPVFASQKSFTVAAGGVIWSILLLGVDFTAWTGLSLVFLMAGMTLVANLPPPAELFKNVRKKRRPTSASNVDHAK